MSGNIQLHAVQPKKLLLAAALCVVGAGFGSEEARAGIHSVPVVLVAKDIRAAQFHPVAMYRMFHSDDKGRATAIPFQIDEKNKYLDYVLEKGPNANGKDSNAIFNDDDELTFMGNDVGPVVVPTIWGGHEPSVLYEIRLTDGQKKGAVYLAVYFKNPPPESPLQYVRYNEKASEINTSRYQYRFSPLNYLVVRGVDILNRDTGPYDLISSSTFFLRADLKWFLTFTINERDVQSDLDAFKTGPVRTIARVNFNYTILKLNFDLGMYTEVSFFSNSVVLPAVIDNPLEGSKAFNPGSLFYYGLALTDNPNRLELSSNMNQFGEKSLFGNMLGSSGSRRYWLTAVAPKYMLYLELVPSEQMHKAGNIPQFYTENKAAAEMKDRTQAAAELGKSPVNMAIGFDLTSFVEGLHEVKFRLFVENFNDPTLLEEYKNVDNWKPITRKVVADEFAEEKAAAKAKKKTP